MKISTRHTKIAAPVLAALSLSVALHPGGEAQAGELYPSYDPQYRSYTPLYSYSPSYREALPSTAAQRESSPLSVHSYTPSLRSSGCYSTLQSNQYESRVLSVLKAEDQYHHKLAVYDAKKAKAERERREKAEKERIALEKRRQEQARTRQAALERDGGRQGLIFRTLDKNKTPTITQASQKTGAEAPAAAAPAKKGPKDGSVWSRIKYIFLGA